ILVRDLGKALVYGWCGVFWSLVLACGRCFREYFAEIWAKLCRVGQSCKEFWAKLCRVCEYFAAKRFVACAE
ncbi:hypothetical protein U1Q18_013673, partial [Sarracenia purpurea var. burkii]